jgi:hypothetical protein
MKIIKVFTGLEIYCDGCGLRYELEPTDPVKIKLRLHRMEKWAYWKCQCGATNQAPIREFPAFWSKQLDGMEFTES